MGSKFYSELALFTFIINLIITVQCIIDGDWIAMMGWLSASAGSLGAINHWREKYLREKYGQ